MSIWAISSKNEVFRFFNRSATTTTTTTAAPGSAAADQQPNAGTKSQQPSKSWVSSKACEWLCVITWIIITLGDITFILYAIHHTEFEIFKHSTPGIVSLAVFFALVATAITAGIQNLARHFQANEAFTSLLGFAVTVLLSITIALLYQNVPENKSVPENENALKNAIDSAANVEKQLMALALNRSITSAYLEYAWNASWAYNVDGLNSCRKLSAFVQHKLTEEAVGEGMSAGRRLMVVLYPRVDTPHTVLGGFLLPKVSRL
ncbi:hypothetical protein NpPPO83_00002877 [Neofusicoccum parvum]|uniref:Uncharacterized protein n=1 Tax=Neofusicoccum parvum TaxID=310453 RepID=A0ACB5S472_9PEZI|nr:hypothetical protein NpPPO83_00002877 [Neofusicoccum parvum]